MKRELLLKELHFSVWWYEIMVTFGNLSEHQDENSDANFAGPPESGGYIPVTRVRFWNTS